MSTPMGYPASREQFLRDCPLPHLTHCMCFVCIEARAPKPYEPKTGDFALYQVPGGGMAAMLILEVTETSIFGTSMTPRDRHSKLEWVRENITKGFAKLYKAKRCGRCSGQGDTLDDCGSCFTRCTLCEGFCVVVEGPPELPLTEAGTPRSSVPDDLRARGWMVAVHNDYMLNGCRMTFWLFTRGAECVKGEGASDAEALNEIRTELTARERAR